jgi:hypothetical protein
MGAPDFSRSSFTSFASIFSVTVDTLIHLFFHLFIPGKVPAMCGAFGGMLFFKTAGAEAPFYQPRYGPTEVGP